MQAVILDNILVLSENCWCKKFCVLKMLKMAFSIFRKNWKNDRSLYVN